MEGQLTLKENASDYSKIYFKNNNTPGRWTLAGFPDTDAAASLFNFYYNNGSSGSDIFQISGQGKVGINHSPTSTSESEGVLSVQGFGHTDQLSLINAGGNEKWGFQVGLYNHSNMHLSYNGVAKGQFISVSGVYSTNSDRRLKENIVPTQSLLGKVQDIKIMDYTFKSDKTHQPQIGYIAQELEKQFPEFVSKPDENNERENYYSVNYAGMSAVAIKAIQEQQEIIEDQQQINQNQAEDLTVMRTLLERLEARIDQLEK